MSYYSGRYKNMNYSYNPTGTPGGQISGYEPVATYMKAMINGKIDVSGSPPQANNLDNIMKSLKQNFPKETFIKGHLLNDNVGGDGLYYNMFPITSSANGSHKQIESEVKYFCEKIPKYYSQIDKCKSFTGNGTKRRPERAILNKVEGNKIWLGDIYWKSNTQLFEIQYSVEVLPHDTQAFLDALNPDCSLHCSLTVIRLNSEASTIDDQNPGNDRYSYETEHKTLDILSIAKR